MVGTGHDYNRTSPDHMADSGLTRVGIDIGGTFTDLFAVADDGRTWSAKVLTTPANPAHGLLDVLDHWTTSAGEHDIREIVHATTVATNAVLEGTTARLGMVTTRGFRDVLEIGRHQRRDLYNLFLEKPPVLIPRERRLEVRERIGADGSIVEPLSVSDVVRAAHQLKDLGAEVVVVAFLHSYGYPQHEREAADVIARETGLPVLASHTVCREYREYERFSTAAVHASILPRVATYVGEIGSRLTERGVTAPLSVMQSSGGMAPAATVAREPASIVESGPAAGVIAAAEVGRRLGASNVISFDMGGTSTKATLIRDGHVTINNDYEIGGGLHGGFGTGYPLRTPVIDLVEIGTGGGSLAEVDASGALYVGPSSAGADPGPACYGRGGTRPTTTDANAVLGRLRPDRFAGGHIQLDVAAARRAVAEHVAGPLGMSVERAAEGILALAGAQMGRALELVSVSLGHDPREFVMVAFGGAGPMHAADLARELGCRQVVIPPEAGVQSARGLLVADARRDFTSAMLSAEADLDLAEVQHRFAAMRDQGRGDLRDAGFEASAIQARLGVDVRYAGQAYEVSVWLDEPATFDKALRRQVNRDFHRAHARLHGHRDEDAAVEWVTLRASVTASTTRPRRTELAPATEPLAQRKIGLQSMIWSGESREAPVYARERLGRDDHIEGPALVIQDQTTLVVPPATSAHVRSTGDIVLEITPR